MDYLELLKYSFTCNCAITEDSTDHAGFLAEYIFGFITYDNQMDSLFGEKAVEVCAAINQKNTFDFIKGEENYRWYLLMVNMPFFSKKLSWGTSIRGAWWELYGDDVFEIDSFGLWQDDEQLLNLKLDKDQWSGFVEAMEAFIKLDVET